MFGLVVVLLLRHAGGGDEFREGTGRGMSPTGT